jgi:hypothetical protein
LGEEVDKVVAEAEETVAQLLPYALVQSATDGV